MNPTKNILTDDQRALASEILATIKASESILLHCHPSPDPDSLGSVLAAKFALESLGKSVSVIAGDSKTPDAFMHFPGATDILPQNYFETDLSQFDLFLVLDSGSPSMISRKAEVALPPVSNPSLVTIVIDHHASNAGYGSINMIATQYVSTTEILFDLFQEWGIGAVEIQDSSSCALFSLSPEIATNLYVGLFTDGGGFRYERITDHSFYMASVLYKSNPDVLRVITVLENSASKKYIDFLGLALSQKKVFESVSPGDLKNSSTNASAGMSENKGSFVISYVSHEDIVRLELASDDLSGGQVCNMMKSVVGWNVVCMMIEEEPSVVKMSFRTRDQDLFDVSKVAMALGGGGHKAAAGAMVKKPILEAIDIVAEKVREILFS